MNYWKLKVKATLLRIANIIIFTIPLIIMLIVYKEEMFTTKTSTGLSGLGIIGIIIYALGLKHSLNKAPKILWFIIILLIAICADYVSEYLVMISLNMLIGYILSIPLSIYIRKLDKNAETIDELHIKENYIKNRKKERMELEEEKEELNGRV